MNPYFTALRESRDQGSKALQYQIFVERQSEKHFVATIIGIPSVSVAAATEAGAFNADIRQSANMRELLC